MAEILKIEFLQNFFSNDKFNRYLKLINIDRSYLRDPKYKEFHKFFSFAFFSLAIPLY